MAWQTARDAVDDSLRCAAVDHFHGAEYSSGTTGRSGAEAAGQVYRALFIRVSPSTPRDVLEEFERDLLRMPTHISSIRSEEHTSELQSLMRISYAVFCLKKKSTTQLQPPLPTHHNTDRSYIT